MTASRLGCVGSLKRRNLVPLTVSKHVNRKCAVSSTSSPVTGIARCVATAPDGNGEDPAAENDVARVEPVDEAESGRSEAELGGR